MYISTIIIFQGIYLSCDGRSSCDDRGISRAFVRKESVTYLSCAVDELYKMSSNTTFHDCEGNNFLINTL